MRAWAHPLLALAPLLTACGDDAPPIEPTYENVEAVMRLSCGSSSTSCHGGARGNAMLNFGALDEVGRPWTEALVDVPSCEYDFLDRVEPGAPERSWLYLKLTAPHNAEGLLRFEPDPAWDPGIAPDVSGAFPPSQCPEVTDGALTFGYQMPRNVGAPQPLPEESIALIEAWILAGAPGP